MHGESHFNDRLSMLMRSRTSATNCARIYNESIGIFEGRKHYQFQSSHATIMDTDNIWDAFFIYSLILDHQRRGSVLSLPHNSGTHRDRYGAALQERNQRFNGHNRDEWNHVCEDCFKLRERGL